jgi:hypothetical protein
VIDWSMSARRVELAVLDRSYVSQAVKTVNADRQGRSFSNSGTPWEDEAPREPLGLPGLKEARVEPRPPAEKKAALPIAADQHIQLRFNTLCKHYNANNHGESARISV